MAEIREHCDITTTKSNGKKITSSQVIGEVVNKQIVYPDKLNRFISAI